MLREGGACSALHRSLVRALMFTESCLATTVTPEIDLPTELRASCGAPTPLHGSLGFSISPPTRHATARGFEKPSSDDSSRWWRAFLLRRIALLPPLA